LTVAASDLWVVVPARGGSTRVPGKNLRLLAGRPLLAYTLQLVIDAGLRNRTVVSSDDNATLALAASFGIRGIERPPELATADASTESALLHALDALGAEGRGAEWVMTLPPTSPFRRAATVRELVALARADPDAHDCLMTVTEDRRDLWRMAADGRLARLFPDAPRRQQDRTPLYEENSAVYLTRVSALRATRSVLGRSVRGVVIDPIEAWDINTETDLVVAEALVPATLRVDEHEAHDASRE
jgi:CMP-N,N'-diacetyllegionaminic acid synthase